MTTSARVSSSVNFTSCTESRMPCERSNSVWIWMPFGTCPASDSISSFTRSATATVFVPGCRCTARTMERAPLYQLALRLFSMSSSTLPNMSSRTAAPLR